MLSLVTLASGSSGNAALLSCGRTHILIDAGISSARIRAALTRLGLTPGDLAAVLLTHAHGDHVRGLDVFCRRYGVRVAASEGTAAELCEAARRALGCTFTPGEGFAIGEAYVESFATPHDSPDSAGFRIYAEDGASVGFATDLGYLSDRNRASLEGCGLIVLESNYDEEMLRTGHYPYSLKRRIRGMTGHLSNDDCARAAVCFARSGTRRIILAHLSEENNTPDLAYTATAVALCTAGAEPGRGVELIVAPRHDTGVLCEVRP